MHVMNKARTMMLEWGEAFLPFVSQGLGKTIVEGYQEMMNDGIRFPPLTESNKWTPCTQLVTPEKPVTSDVKDFYRHIKQAMGTIEEKGTAYFQTNEGTKGLEECRRRMPDMDAILTSASDESTLQHVKKLKEMCKQVIELGEKVDDDWSDNPHSEDGWDESPTRDLWNESPSQKARSDSHSHSQRTSDDTFSQTAWEEAKEPKHTSSEWESEPVVTIRKTRKRSVHSEPPKQSAYSEPPKQESEVFDFMDM